METNDYVIINPEDGLEPGNLIILLYGRPGVGKTSVAFTANNPLNLDFDGGLARAVKRKKTVKFKSWSGYEKWVKDGHLASVRGGTLIVDTVKAMLDDYIGAHVVAENHNNGKKGGGISQQGFGVMREIFAQFIREARNYEVDLIFIAHAIAKVEGKSSLLIPAMTGGSYEILVAKADLIGFMETRNNNAVIEFSPTDGHIGKNSAEFPVIRIPHYTDPHYDGFFGRLIEEAKERRQRMTLEQESAVRASDGLRADVDKMIDLNTIAGHVGRIAQLPVSYQEAAANHLTTRYMKIFQEVHLNPANSADQLSALVLAMSEVPEKIGRYEVRKACKIALNEKASHAGFVYNQGDKRFTQKPIADKPKQASA